MGLRRAAHEAPRGGRAEGAALQQAGDRLVRSNGFFFFFFERQRRIPTTAAEERRRRRTFSFFFLSLSPPSHPPLLLPLSDRWWPELIRQVKYNAFFQGSVPQYLLYLSSLPVTGSALLGGKIAAIRDRRFFVNRYGPATAGKPRLSFSYYELDVSKLPQALPAMLAHAADFRRRTGWAPGALAIYFVKRDGIRGESNYAGPPGVSCTMDPVTVRGGERESGREGGEGAGRASGEKQKNEGKITHFLRLSLFAFFDSPPPGSPRRPALPPVPRGERRAPAVLRRDALALAVAPHRDRPRPGHQLRRPRPVSDRGAAVRDAVPEAGLGRGRAVAREQRWKVGGNKSKRR